jgi:hypothetical protein
MIIKSVKCWTADYESSNEEATNSLPISLKELAAVVAWSFQMSVMCVATGHAAIAHKADSRGHSTR